MSTELATTSAPRSADDLVAQVHLIEDVMKRVMKKGEHYGAPWPGASKPSLLKPGAEKVCQLFRLVPKYDYMSLPQPHDHVKYVVKCTLLHQPTGTFAGEGMGSATSMETRNKNRTPADLDNNVLKIACKRAYVAATISATAASDVFSQDAEDLSGGNKEGGDNKASTSIPPSELQSLKGMLNRVTFNEKSGYYNGEVKGIRFGTKDTALGEDLKALNGVEVTVQLEEKTSKGGSTWFLLKNLQAVEAEADQSEPFFESNEPQD